MIGVTSPQGPNDPVAKLNRDFKDVSKPAQRFSFRNWDSALDIHSYVLVLSFNTALKHARWPVGDCV